MTFTERFIKVADLTLGEISNGIELGTEKAASAAKKYLFILGVIGALSFIPSIVLISMGKATDSNALVMLGGLWRSAFTIILLFLAYPIITAIDISANGFKGSLGRFFQIVITTSLFELLCALIIMFIPISRNLPMLPALILVGIIIGTVVPFYVHPKAIAAVAGGFGVIIIASFFFPGTFSSLDYKTKSADDKSVAPQETGINCSNYNSTHYFFSQDGEAKYFYRINDAGAMELLLKQTDKKVIDPKTGEALNELDNKGLKKFLRQMQEQCAPAPNNANKNYPTGNYKLAVMIISLEHRSNRLSEFDSNRLSQILNDSGISTTNSLNQHLPLNGSALNGILGGDGRSILDLHLEGYAERIIVGKKIINTTYFQPQPRMLEITVVAFFDFWIIDTATGQTRHVVTEKKITFNDRKKEGRATDLVTEAALADIIKAVS